MLFVQILGKIGAAGENVRKFTLDILGLSDPLRSIFLFKTHPFRNILLAQIHPLTLDGMTYRIPVHGKTSEPPLQKSVFQLSSFYKTLQVLRGNKIIRIGEKKNEEKTNIIRNLTPQMTQVLNSIPKLCALIFQSLAISFDLIARFNLLVHIQPPLGDTFQGNFELNLEMIKWLNLASIFWHSNKHRKLASKKYMIVFLNPFCIQNFQIFPNILLTNNFSNLYSQRGRKSVQKQCF